MIFQFFKLIFTITKELQAKCRNQEVESAGPNHHEFATKLMATKATWKTT